MADQPFPTDLQETPRDGVSCKGELLGKPNVPSLGKIEKWPCNCFYISCVACFSEECQNAGDIGADMKGLVFAAAVFAFACHCAPSRADDERSCQIMAAAALLSGKTNCRDGDIATISGVTTKEVPEAIARYCDFWAQIVVLPDASASDASSHFVLCKYRQREAAPSQP